MSVGSLATLMTMLRAAPTLVAAGASVEYGEEMVSAQDKALPMVVIVPGDSTFPDIPGYVPRGTAGSTKVIAVERQSIDLYLWAADPDAQPVDNADAVGAFMAQVLQALVNQAPNGLKYFQQSARWEKMGNAVSRYGRAKVLTVTVDIPILDVPPVEATITTETLSAELTDSI